MLEASHPAAADFCRSSFTVTSSLLPLLFHHYVAVAVVSLATSMIDTSPLSVHSTHSQDALGKMEFPDACFPSAALASLMNCRSRKGSKPKLNKLSFPKLASLKTYTEYDVLQGRYVRVWWKGMRAAYSSTDNTNVTEKFRLAEERASRDTREISGSWVLSSVTVFHTYGPDRIRRERKLLMLCSAKFSARGDFWNAKVQTRNGL